MAALSALTSMIPSANAEYTAPFALAVTATRGQTGYLDTSVSPPVVRLAGAASTAIVAGSVSTNGAVGFIESGGVAGQLTRLVFRDPALVLGVTVLAGDDIWLSPTAGSATKTIGDLASTNYKLHFGTMISTTVLAMKITGPGLLA